jgi:hypothetical protein
MPSLGLRRELKMHLRREPYLKALRLSSTNSPRFKSPGGACQLWLPVSSSATRQSRAAQRAGGLALDGRSGRGHAGVNGGQAPVSPPSLVSSPVMLSGHLTLRHIALSRNSSVRLRSRLRRSHIFALASCMRMSQRRVALNTRACTGSWLTRAYAFVDASGFRRGSRYPSSFVSIQYVASARCRATAPTAFAWFWRARTRVYSRTTWRVGQ